MHTADDRGILNNYATEPTVYRAEFFSTEQRSYTFVAEVVPLFAS